MSVFSLYFLNKTFSVTWYLKSLILSNKPLNRTLMLHLLASNWTKGSFESIISVLHLLVYLLNASDICFIVKSSKNDFLDV